MPNVCTYWERQEFRDIDDHGFGFTPELTRAETQARAVEDVDDPPCGDCAACNDREPCEACGELNVCTVGCPLAAYYAHLVLQLDEREQHDAATETW